MQRARFIWIQYCVNGKIIKYCIMNLGHHIERVSLVLLLASSVCCGQNVQQHTVFQIKNELKSVIVDRKVAHMVRAVFHDCLGGCDGCINRAVHHNMGCDDGTSWIETVNELDSLYDNYYSSSGLSRADIYVLAAEAGIENAVDLANHFAPNYIPMPQFKFRYGRVDCSPDGQTDVIRVHPRSNMGADELFMFFRYEFDMDVAETVAIMGGGHTLGGSTGFTGWIGFWKGVGQEGEIAGNRFDNGYFKFLVNPNFEYLQQSIPQPLCSGVDKSPKFQWNSFQNNTQKSFALNVDMAIVKDILLDPNTGQSSCTYENCTDSVGAVFTNEFANNVQTFVNKFEVAWEKMSTAGATNLKTPGSDRKVKSIECEDTFGLCRLMRMLCPRFFAMKKFCPFTCGICQGGEV